MTPVRGEVLVLLNTLKPTEVPAIEVITSQGALDDAVRVPVQDSQARFAGMDGARPPVEVPRADTFAEKVCTTLFLAFTSAPWLMSQEMTVSAPRREAP